MPDIKTCPMASAGCIWLTLALILLPAYRPAVAQDQQATGDWIPLFNGESLDGWEGDPAVRPGCRTFDFVLDPVD